MILEPQEIVSGKNLSATSSEIDFAIVLSRVIGSIENDPAQLRNAVYELARIKLQTELSQRETPIDGSDKGNLASIERIETEGQPPFLLPEAKSAQADVFENTVVVTLYTEVEGQGPGLVSIAVQMKP